MTADVKRPARPEHPAARLAAAYRWLATTLLTTLLLFAALNVAAAALLALGVGVPEPGPLRYGIEPLRAAYPGSSEGDIRALLTEVWTRPYAYESFTEFREAAFEGRHFHILAEGFRSAGHPQPWPPDRGRPTVFVFGGSTALGYGVGDGETLPAQLERELADAPCGDPAVYNFARSSYFSTQERILFEQLVLAGTAPDVAVFVDGLNEFAYPEGEPKFTPRLRYLMAETDAQLARRLLVRLPAARLVKGLRGTEEVSASGARSPDLAARVVERWMGNRRLLLALGDALGIQVLHVWQPVAVYGAPPGANPFLGGPGGELPNQTALEAGYRLLEERFESGDPELDGASFLWLADHPASGGAPLYVDRAHYSPAFTRLLAAAIAPRVAAALCGATEPAG